jgi:hypothetical protein
LIVVAAALVPAPATAQTGPYGILVSGIDHTTPRSQIAALLQLARDGGAQWVRTDFWWYSAQWSRGSWDWRFFDAVVEEATARGLQLIPTLWGTPLWAATDGVFAHGVPDMAAWEAFVSATATRYRGRITRWEIWNEPDLWYFWRGTPRQYAEVLARAYRQIKGADPHASVLLGGLAQGGGASPAFLQQILADSANPAGYFFDYHNIHTNFRYMEWIATQIRDNRAILSSYGFPKPVVVTESSYTSHPAHQNLVGYRDGEAGQARYVSDAYQTMLAAGVEIAVWASLMDSGGTGSYADSGLVRTDRSRKPAFEAYRQRAAMAPPPAPSGLKLSSTGGVPASISPR